MSDTVAEGTLFFLPPLPNITCVRDDVLNAVESI